MKSTDHDDAIVRVAMQHLKDSDARERPSFAATLAGRPARNARLRYSAPRLIAVAAVVIGVVVTYRETRPRSEILTVPEDITALIAWRAESNVFLPSPTSLMGAPSPLEQSAFEFHPLTRDPQL